MKYILLIPLLFHIACNNDHTHPPEPKLSHTINADYYSNTIIGYQLHLKEDSTYELCDVSGCTGSFTSKGTYTVLNDTIYITANPTDSTSYSDGWSYIMPSEAVERIKKRVWCGDSLLLHNSNIVLYNKRPKQNKIP